ncbi:hypothetical protein [Actinopolymorpha alba]|uniref:hypothetical protein n=1 Tax=Actinopolymorpha alba TaxID=533267 RepID=UPI0003A94147|nr:hypothetical protein [Actinopolymorpha alba]
MVRAGGLAPSVGTPHPCQFVVQPGGFEIWIGSPCGPPEDPRQRLMLISAGAAAHNICVAVRALGRDAEACLLPRSEEPCLVTAVGIGAPWPPSPDNELEYAALTGQSRPSAAESPLAHNPLPETLERAAAAEGGFLRILAAPEAQPLEQLILQALRDGDDSGGEVGRTMIWDPDGPVLYAVRDAVAVDHRPALAVLSSWGDNRKAWIRTGMALQHVLLTATACGLAAWFLSPSIELTAQQWLWYATAGGVGWPQLVLRLGSTPS